MNVLIALLVFITATSAIPAHFPREKTLVYKYYADVKTGTIEPVPYASQFALDGVLYIKHDTSDITLKNAYYVTLSNVKFGLHNGQAVHYQRVDEFHPIYDAAKVLEDPFLIIYDENGKFQGIKLQKNETNWSKNMKQAIASMLQLDLSSMLIDTPIKPHSFITMENTIYGVCQVSYDVHPKDQHHPDNVFVVTKLYEPKNCTHFIQQVHDHMECTKCHVESEDAMSTASRRVFEIENQGRDILVKTLVGHGVVNYFPWQAKSEAHYILNNQSLVLESVIPATQVHLPVVNFQGMDIVRDISFNKPETNYALLAGQDLTQGRHLMSLESLIPKLKKMLTEAADYLEENHLEMKEPDWKHGQTINRIHHTMNYMDLGSLEEVYNAIQDPKTPREETIRAIFLEMVPTVGTTASCLFVRNAIRKQKVPNPNAIMMLHKLPMHVKLPNELLLLEMEDLLKLGTTVSMDVRVASILCFSNLIHKTFQQEDVVNPLITRYVQRFYDHVKNEPTYHMKMVYMMALKNIRVIQVCQILEPIIRGSVMISEKPYHIRVQAIWAVQDVIVKNPQYAHDLFWPILADTSLPLTVRIAAYNVLIKQLPDMGRIMNLYWFMVYEKNEHLYNYHLTTIKGLANSVDPCLRPVREMARKILRFTRIRPVTEVLSANYFVDYVNPKYEYGESVHTAFIFDELTGQPHTGSFEHSHMIARKVVPTIGVYWNMNGLDEIMKLIKTKLMGNVMDVIKNENVLNVLLKAAKDMPTKKDIHLDLCITLNGQVSHVMHYDKETWIRLFNELQKFKNIVGVANMNAHRIFYNVLYEMHVPTDMGLPAVFETQIPTSMHFNFSSVFPETKTPLHLNLKMDTRFWQHGEYAMSIYNPIADVWHSVRRVISHDAVFPVDMTVSYNYAAGSLKVSLPRLPVNKFSTAGMIAHAKNYVTVTEDETDVLKRTCATCHHYEVVTKGTAHKKYYQTTADSKDTGLQYSMAIFDCESEVTPVTFTDEWMKALSSEHKHTWNNVFVQYIMGARQQMIKTFISPEIGSCGSLIKVEPSTVHPTSSVDVNMRISVEDLDHLLEKMHVLSSRRVNFHGTVDVKAASTNTTVRSWDINAIVDSTQGHFNNNLKVQVTRLTPGEKKLKICVDGQKNYPVLVVDPLKLGITREETNAKVTFTMGMTDLDTCVHDDTVVTMTIKGETTDEQKKQMSHDSVHGACAQDTQKEQFVTQQGHIPKTWDCIRETILHTTLRKYTIKAIHKKVPQSIVSKVIMLEDIIRSAFLSHLRYTTNYVDSGNIKMVVEYPVGTNYMSVSVNTPTRSYEIVEVPIGDKLWNVLMDNTHFSVNFLHKLLNKQIKLCTVYPHVLLTADNSTLPFTVPTEWTLVSGDYVRHTFAVFAKVVEGNKMAVKMHIGNHVVEMIPHDITPTVTIDGNVMEQLEKGIVVPTDEFNNYVFKITKNNEHVVVQSHHVPVVIMCTPNSVTLTLDVGLQGLVTGMCGHMDNTHKEKTPKIYTEVV